MGGRRRFKSVLLYCLLIVFIALSFFGYEIYKLAARPLLVESAAPVTIIIDKNASASSFTKILKEKHLINSSRLFLMFIRLQGLTNRLKAGIYQLKPGETAHQLLRKVESGQVMVQSFRITEGSTLNQVKSNLQSAPYLEYSSNDWQELLANNKNVEGLLLADTYNYNAGSEAKYVLRLANRKLQEYLATSWQNRSPDLPYNTSYELLIAASILEKETSLAAERKIISGVIVNRIKKNMPLQMDPTVIYALGQNYTGKLSHEDMSINSPYNTYNHRGLPPTPIAMVGKSAIDAAAHPSPSTYLYFVAKGDGSHQFSTTYEEQKEAISRYLTKRPK
ncbi:MAG: endolytic transglycosylase MltG [Tatlockia sp.]|nr:endolytic transglycosylase MltG [Tatlockia sp.]